MVYLALFFSDICRSVNKADLCAFFNCLGNGESCRGRPLSAHQNGGAKGCPGLIVNHQFVSFLPEKLVSFRILVSQGNPGLGHGAAEQRFAGKPGFALFACLLGKGSRAC